MTAQWMADCVDCLRLWRAFDRSTEPGQVDEAVHLVLGHLVKDHADRLPARRVGCTKCAEYARALNLGPNILTPTIRGIIQRHDDEHRAGHLWEWAPWIVERRSAA